MGKDKLRRFAEFREFSNSYEMPFEMKGKWKRQCFENNHPLVIELACGKGEYTVGLARENPEKNFVGIDKKSNRMWRGAKTALENSLTNVAFARLNIAQLEDVFAPGEIDEIWLTFPDPFPKDRHEKHRLTHPQFIAKYKKVLAPGGVFHFKTDDDALFEYTVNVLNGLKLIPQLVVYDLDAEDENANKGSHFETHYEKMFRARGRKIKYLKVILGDG